MAPLDSKEPIFSAVFTTLLWLLSQQYFWDIQKISHLWRVKASKAQRSSWTDMYCSADVQIRNSLIQSNLYMLCLHRPCQWRNVGYRCLPKPKNIFIAIQSKYGHGRISEIVEKISQFSPNPRRTYGGWKKEKKTTGFPPRKVILILISDIRDAGKPFVLYWIMKWFWS